MLPRESKGQMPSVQQESKEVSIYTGELTPKCIAVEMKKLGVAFPDLDPEFLNVLTERVVENGFTNERLQDAVGELIDTFQYKRPSVANIINYDKRMRLYSHSEVVHAIHNHEVGGFEDFEHYRRDGKLFWIKKNR